MRVILAAAVALALLIAAACAHEVASLPIAAIPPVHLPAVFVIPLGANDEAKFCVQSTLQAGVDPADSYPLRCTSVGAVRHWLRGQRMADE